MDRTITVSDLDRFSKSFESDPKNLLALDAVTTNGIVGVALSREEVDKTNFTFNYMIDSADATNQERSGRCWLFSGLSLLALEAIKKLNLRTFEFSEIYQMFWDKLEKANYFLENIIEMRTETTDSRVLRSLLSDPLSDGGQWNMFANLVNKYGVVPKICMPETVSSNDSELMDMLLASKLREYASTLREMYANGADQMRLRDAKGEQLDEFYRMLCIHLGRPPREFFWEWRDKDEEFHRRGTITPTQFYDEYVGIDLGNMVTLINAPTEDKPFNRLYTVKYLGNVVEGREVRYLNVNLSTMKNAAINMIKGMHAVWFGCDVGKMLQTEMGAMDLNIYDYELVYGTGFRLDKARRLEYGDSEMTHAMLLTGVDLDDAGKPIKWRVENSWGANIGNQGYMYMMDKWFDQYLYEIVVRKEYLSTEFQRILDTEPTRLPPWDPMGSLAK